MSTHKETLDRTTLSYSALSEKVFLTVEPKKSAKNQDETRSSFSDTLCNRDITDEFVQMMFIYISNAEFEGNLNEGYQMEFNNSSNNTKVVVSVKVVENGGNDGI